MTVNFCPLLSAHDNSPTFTYEHDKYVQLYPIPLPSPLLSGYGNGELGMESWEWGLGMGSVQTPFRRLEHELLL